MDTVVYRARPGSDLDQAIAVLTGKGLNPILLDDPKPDILTMLATMGTARVRIAVPEAQATDAANALIEWEKETAPKADALARQFERQALVAIAIAAVIGAVIYFLT
jgi:hypothetical protein